MKMGELRFSPMTEQFYLMTPAGERPVTLRCTQAGVVMVEEVAGGGLSIQPLQIQVQHPAPLDTQVGKVRETLVERRKTNRRKT